MSLPEPADIERAGGYVRLEPGREELGAMLSDLRARQALERRRRVVAAAAVVACIALGAWWASRSEGAPGAPEPSFAPPDVPHIAQKPPEELPSTHVFADGSTMTALRESEAVAPARLEHTEERPGVVRTSMTRGKARFDVVPNPKRTFEVRAGDVRVEVLGTSFDVTYEVGRVSVDVAHGRVRVVAPDEEYVLTAGERVAVLVEERSPEEDKPTEVPEPLDPIAPEEGTDSAPSVKAARRVREARPERWQDMVDDGRFEDAANMLEVERTTPTLDTLDEYLLAADAMVHVGRPQRALDYLGQGLERFPDARSAAVAKFQRARILLRDAKRYEDAARAFASIADDAGAPSLHEDALAREIQAWARAGRPDMARARAKLYFERFPHGRRRKLVERYSGVTP